MTESIERLSAAVEALVEVIKKTAFYGEPCEHEWVESTEWPEREVCTKCEEIK